MAHKIVNLTPHEVVIMDGENNAVCRIAPSGEVARCKAVTVAAGAVEVNGIEIPLSRTQYGEVEGLPEPEPDTMYLVSNLVRLAVTDRSDVCVPGEQVRDADGRIIGCRSLGVS